MEYENIKQFTKYVVLKYLRQIVLAEEQGQSVQTKVPALTEIARGLPLLVRINYLSILSDTYKIQVIL